MQKHKQVILTISVLVSGREKTTERCLDSLIPLMDAVSSELILVDTGCSQEFIDKLRKYTDQIIPFTWCNDFSKARNVGLEHAHGEWFLYLDDDEWFTEIDELIKFFQDGDYREYHRANYIQRNFQDALLTYYSDSWVSRMIRIEKDTHFESKIHEYLAPAHGKNKNIKAIAYHTGYIFQTEEDKLRHFERNSVLLLDMIEKEPKRLRWKVQLVQEYRGIKDWNNLYNFSKQCLKETRQMNSPMENRDIGTFYVGAVEGLLFLGDNEKAEKIAKEGLADKRMNRLCKAHLLLQLGVAYFREEQLTQSEESLLKYLDHYNFLMTHEEILQEQQGVLLVEEAVDDISVKKAYSILCCCGLKKKDTAYLKKYYKKLQWEKKVIYVCDDFPPVLLEAMGTMQIEDIFVSVWKDAWKNADLRSSFTEYIESQKEQDEDVFYRLLKIISVVDAMDEYTLYANILLTDKKKDITFLNQYLSNKKVSFLERVIPGTLGSIEYEQMKMLEQLCDKMDAGVKGKLFKILLQRELVIKSNQVTDFSELRERLEKFSDFTQAFLSEYYKKNILEEYTELLPIYGQVALLIGNALPLENADSHKALELYREIVYTDAAYANVISEYMRMFGDQLAAKDTQKELDELKENVLLKVYADIKKHQYAEASMILSEVKKSLPNDLVIAKMALEVRLLMLQEE